MPFVSSYNEEVALAASNLWSSGVRTLRWSAGPLSDKEPWAESWADVYVEELCRAMETNWLLSVISPQEKPGDGEKAVAPDAALVLRLDGSGPRALYVPPFGDPIEIRDREAYLQERFLVEENIYRVPVWSKECLERTVGDWLLEISGHSFQMQFDPEAESPIFAEIETALREVQSGQAETFDLGDGIQATSGALDGLLQDPEAAAEIMKQLKRGSNGF